MRRSLPGMLVFAVVAACTAAEKPGTSGTTAAGDDGSAGDDGDGTDGTDGGGDEGTDGSSGGAPGGEGDDAWRDDPRLVEVDPETEIFVYISAPNWGQDLAVQTPTITLAGSTVGPVTALRWETPDDGGELAAGETWVAEDLPLAEGDTPITLIATSDAGTEARTSLWVTHAPGVPLAGGLHLSAGAVEAGTTALITASVQTTDRLDTLLLGPTDEEGALSETWATLEDPDEDGVWTGSFSPPTDAPADWQLRAVATVDTLSGSTPPVRFAVLPALSDSEFTVMEDLQDAVATAMDAEDAGLDAAEAAAAVLLANSDVEDVFLSVDGETVEYTLYGIGHILYQPLTGSMGAGPEVLTGAPGALVEPSPPPAEPSRSTARSPAVLGAARTMGRHGPAGPPPVAVSTNDRIVSLAPFKDHFIGTHDEDGDGVDDIEIPLELTEFWPGLIDERELTCPELGTLSRQSTTAVTLDAVAEGLSAGTFTLSSHGMLTRSAVGGGAGPARGVIATRQPIGARRMSPENRASLRSKSLLNVRAHGEWVVAWTDGWVRELHGPDNPMPGTFVGITACKSGSTPEPLTSLRGAGAALAYGFEGRVSAAGGLHTDVAIVRGHLEREEGNAWLDTVGRRYPADGSTLVWASQDDVYLGEEEILKNGSFEQAGSDDPLHWTSVNIYGTDFAAFRVEEYVTTEPTDGDWLAYMFTYDGDPNYAELGQDVCPVPGQWMQLDFDWMVRTDEGSSCGSTAVPNWMNVRIQPHPDDPSVLWHVGWSDVCPLLYDSGDSFQTTTGWQHATVLFEAPDAPDPSNQRLVFTVGGYNSAGWIGLMDNVTLGYAE